MQLRQVVLRGLLRGIFHFRMITRPPEFIERVASISLVTDRAFVGVKHFFLAVDVTWKFDRLTDFDQSQHVLDVLIVTTLPTCFGLAASKSRHRNGTRQSQSRQQ